MFAQNFCAQGFKLLQGARQFCRRQGAQNFLRLLHQCCGRFTSGLHTAQFTALFLNGSFTRQQGSLRQREFFAELLEPIGSRFQLPLLFD